MSLPTPLTGLFASGQALTLEDFRVFSLDDPQHTPVEHRHVLRGSSPKDAGINRRFLIPTMACQGTSAASSRTLSGSLAAASPITSSFCVAADISTSSAANPSSVFPLRNRSSASAASRMSCR